MKKYPFENIIYYLMLCKNSYSDISKFLSGAGIGKVTGRELKTFSSNIRKAATNKEKLELDKNSANPKRKPKKNKLDSGEYGLVEIKTEIDKSLRLLAKKIKIPSGNPFNDDSIPIILSSNTIRRCIEVYLTSNMDVKELSNVIEGKFSIPLSVKTVDLYRKWFYNTSGMIPEAMFSYFDSLGRTESEYKRMAYMNKPDFVRWKMRDDFSVDPKEATNRIMSEAFFTIKELFDDKDRLHHNAIKSMSDIYFRAVEQMSKMSELDSSSEDIFKTVRIVLKKSSGDKAIDYDELIAGNKND